MCCGSDYGGKAVWFHNEDMRAPVLEMNGGCGDRRAGSHTALLWDLGGGEGGGGLGSVGRVWMLRGEGGGEKGLEDLILGGGEGWGNGLGVLGGDEMVLNGDAGNGRFCVLSRCLLSDC